MSTSTWIRDGERETLRRMRREGMTIEEIVVASGRSQTTVHEAVRDVETVMITRCGHCSGDFTYEPRRGRPPGYCSDECRRQASLKRKRDARARIAT